MLHHIRSLTGRTLNWLYDHHRRSVPGLDVQDPAAPRVGLYQGGLRKSTNLGHYREEEDHTRVLANEGQPKDAETESWQS